MCYKVVSLKLMCSRKWSRSRSRIKLDYDYQLQLFLSRIYFPVSLVAISCTVSDVTNMTVATIDSANPTRDIQICTYISEP
ncbi:uncharacterized protein SPAPADRAFT_61024 [Spathaspora passalidarum NRRL Y-27907]|uniref:Uncharacterized protein n=1 Tax=Spathaspora passalidarum (strain NRRL Y-27907 / 11-Y1) TaxID=619300 RepID=G3AN78_SPAPN|nr:uncharacterized protein SPAPADRAFT_61024 [Spathaspora passalidarum NRRL Y-27907]EGW31921.1 hypothetical protein SPAPADRAFT_61024 [Spathaspora passalidarum NRRL Y-27907]